MSAPIVPETIPERIAFYQAHLEPWAAHAAEIGVDPARIAGLAELVAAAKAAHARAVAARLASQAATTALHAALRDLHAGPRGGGGIWGGQSIIDAVRIHAESTGEPGRIYALAQLPPPRPSGPRGNRTGGGPGGEVLSLAPGTPTNFAARLIPATGALELRWTCRNPRGSQGTVYEVSRGARGDGMHAGSPVFEHLATTGVKRYLDETIPAAAGQIQYRITAIRGARRGHAALSVVNLGASTAAAMREAEQPTDIRLAA